jgi:tRNA G18 (ribose-2'-O)-methylase SpoU
MATWKIDSPQDPRLEAFLDLRHRNPTWISGRFITEGKLVTDRLLSSGWTVESLLVAPRHAECYRARIPPDCELLIAEERLMADVVGYQFHRGVLACGLRPAMPTLLPLTRPLAPREVLVGTWGVQDPENLGNMMRCAAAFGAQRFILGPHTADPLSRRALRVSMGTAFRLDLLRSVDLESDVGRFATEAGGRCAATVLDETAISLDDYRPQSPVLLLFGNEAHGLPSELIAAADDRITLPMALGTDSLNVGVAAGIFLYALTRAHR